MTTKCLINSIYRATEGEGVNIGTSQIFVRFQGCAVGCLNCDSKDTWDFDEKTAMSVESVIDAVYEQAGKYPHQIKRVSITGGDPLHPKLLPSVVELASRLKKEGFTLYLEAAGTRVVGELFDLIDFVNFDFKTPSTGVKTNPELIIKMAQQYPGKFQVKSVIADRTDFAAAFEAFQKVREKVATDFPWCLTPSYETHESFPQKRFQDVINMNEEFGGAFRVIGQQHKWIHGADQKQV
jgi:7-carboxy-7-deazaguanine synthase